jgi:uncharacterized protein (TIGR02453 family)
MKNDFPLGIDERPSFAGFPVQALRFLRRLKKNNNREWFLAHKGEFEDYVKAPMQALVSALQPGFQSFAPEFDLDPAKSIFRIYRDIRFSKDKSPYKTHIAAHFVIPGNKKGVEGSGYYLQIAPGDVFLGGGIYIPDGDQLKNIRRSISAKHGKFLQIIKNNAFRRQFGELEGNKLQRVPAGYSPDDPLADFLKLKQFFVGIQFKDEECEDERFVNRCLKVCKTAAPFVDFLNAAVHQKSR